ncbi:outer envelope membrane protein 7-like [Phalaenopsis equestris]|uniref:outer envelope membrane protein 7-like n=1 Tax=Phalaenopsis equestris TaxID=78828 RepID=UPI0009E32FB5|nr:outer envelope membrane protein 7-like [Phalaenopsis equestris]
MGGRDRDRGALKSVLVVAGGLALAWVTMETAFKPWLDRLRSAMARSDPTADPDDVDTADTPTIGDKTEEDVVNVEEEVKTDKGIQSSD